MWSNALPTKPRRRPEKRRGKQSSCPLLIYLYTSILFGFLQMTNEPLVRLYFKYFKCKPCYIKDERSDILPEPSQINRQ